MAAVCVIAVAVGHFIALPQLGMTSEDVAWEAFFSELSLGELWCTPHGSYRPTCGMLLHLSAPLPWGVKIAISGVLHLVASGLAGGLAWRIAGKRAAFWATCIPMVWSTQPEVVLWLGGRCELMWVVPGLLGAHCVLSGTRDARWRWPLLAALCCAAAALGKEPGFLLPAAYAPLLGGRNRPTWIRLLGPSVAALIAVFVLRAVVMQGGGAYVGELASRGPVDWAGNLALAYTKLALGSTVRWPNWLSVVVPLLGAGVTVVIARRFDRCTSALVVAALFVLMAPTALVHAPRTLYGSVAFVAVVLGLFVDHLPALRQWLGLVLALHAAATLGGQGMWAHISQQRAGVVSAVIGASRASGNDRVLMLGLRWRPYGVPAAVVVRGDFDAPIVADPFLASRYAENEWNAMQPVTSVQVTGDCRARIGFTIPAGPRVLPPDVAVLAERPLRVRVGRPLTLLYTTDESGLSWVAIPCEHPPIDAGSQRGD